MTENVRRLYHGVFRRDAPVSPDLNDQLVVIRALPDTGVLDAVAHAPYRRKQRVNRDHTNRLLQLLVLLGRTETATDLDFQLDFKVHLLVQRADVLVGVEHLHHLVALDVRRRYRPFLIGREIHDVRLAAVRFQQHFLQVEHNVGHVLDDAGDARKLVRSPFDLDGTDARAFERTEQHPSQRVANRMSVSRFERLGHKLGIRRRRAGVIPRQPLGHFKST